MGQENKQTTPLQVMRNIEFELETLKEYIKQSNTNDATALLLCNAANEQLSVKVGGEKNIVKMLIDIMEKNPEYGKLILLAGLYHLQNSGKIQGRVISISSNNPLASLLLRTLFNDTDNNDSNS